MTDASVRLSNQPSTLYMTLIFDLLTPKVDCFMLFPRVPLVPICIKVISLICLQNIVFPSLVTDEQTNGRRDWRTTREQCLCNAASQAWRWHYLHIIFL